MKLSPFILVMLASLATSACFSSKSSTGADAAYNKPNKFGYRGSETDPAGANSKPSAAPDGAIAKALSPAPPSGSVEQRLSDPTPAAGTPGSNVAQPILPTANASPTPQPDAGVKPKLSTPPPPPPPPVSTGSQNQPVSTGTTGTTGTTSSEASKQQTPVPPTPVKPKDDYPYGIPVPGKEGMVYSPYDKEAGYVDVRGMKPGALVEDPYSKKYFRVP